MRREFKKPGTVTLPWARLRRRPDRFSLGHDCEIPDGRRWARHLQFGWTQWNSNGTGPEGNSFGLATS